MALSVKVTFRLSSGEQLRRFTVSGWEDFVSRIQQFSGVSDVSTLRFQYEDDEGDIVTFDSEEEFVVAMSMPGELHRITVTPKQADPKGEFWPFRCPRRNRFGKKRCPFRRGRRCGRRGPRGPCGPCGPFGRGRRFGGRGGRFGCPPFMRGLFRRFGCCPPSVDGQKCHLGVRCDGPGCEKRNWIGKRFKCSDCDNYDLCGECMNRSDLETFHSGDHSFAEVEMRSLPSWGRRFRGGRCPCPCPFKMGMACCQKEQEEEQGEQEDEVEDEGEVEAPSVVDSPVVTVPEEVEVVKPEPEPEPEPEREPTIETETYPYELQMKLLVSMGFSNEVQNRDLLARHGGNLNRVVEGILQQ